MQLVLLRTLLLLAALLSSGRLAQAQDTGRQGRADTAARTTSVLQRTQAATATSSQYALQAEADIGELVPVRTRALGLDAYLIGSAGLNYTSNPSLSNNGGRGDLYFVGGGGAGVRPNLIGGLYLDGHVSQFVYQYAQFSSLNFSYFNAGGGFDYVFANLGDLTASIRYEYERFLDGGSLDEFYVNHALPHRREIQLSGGMAWRHFLDRPAGLSTVPRVRLELERSENTPSCEFERQGRADGVGDIGSSITLRVVEERKNIKRPPSRPEVNLGQS